MNLQPYFYRTVDITMTATMVAIHTPAIPMQPSPADSLMSAPCENYPSLFSTPGSMSVSPTMHPIEMLTPSSPGEAMTPSGLSVVPEDLEPLDAGAKKSTKKRKSWGQVLPEPKTNLPPRKRAKTDDEKEQRRVERVLRNRRAAQSSRERKRLEVEALETRNQELEAQLRRFREDNTILLEELQRHRRDSSMVLPAGSITSLDNTLSSQLFADPKLSTVNPASLSPEPSDELSSIIHSSLPLVNLETAASSTDLTQRPAVMLCATCRVSRWRSRADYPYCEQCGYG